MRILTIAAVLIYTTNFSAAATSVAGEKPTAKPTLIQIAACYYTYTCILEVAGKCLKWKRQAHCPSGVRG